MKDLKSHLFLETVEKTRIHVRELKPGMFVCELDCPWEQTNFLFQGFVLQNQADIEAVQAQCQYVYIDVSKQINIIQQPKVRDSMVYSSDWIDQRQPPKRTSNFEDEIYNAAKIHKNTSTIVKSFMQEVALGNTVNVELAKKAVSECVNSILKSPDAMIWLTQLKKRDEHTSQHSMNVCILSISLGRQLNLPVEELNHIGLCGMMHDMGKMRIPLQVLNKPGRLTDEELKIMQSHTTLGWKLLMSSNNMFGGAIDVAYTHHERLDGKGYPRGLKADGIGFYARIVAIADTYDAITSDRIYQRGRTHLEAIGIMTKEVDTHLDANLTIKFIECLGIYPPGNLVEMSNGEVAVVIESHPQHKLIPKVIFLLDEQKKPQHPRLIDLAQMSLDRSGQPYKIKRMVRAEDYGIDLKDFYQTYLTNED
jgi:HD-GYP domain-containing protein (c-di-GMP phosphodiesterase class II)